LSINFCSNTHTHTHAKQLSVLVLFTFSKKFEAASLLSTVKTYILNPVVRLKLAPTDKDFSSINLYSEYEKMDEFEKQVILKIINDSFFYFKGRFSPVCVETEGVKRLNDNHKM
jgi:hypothetical protein